jgi:hypothetical protein
MRHLDENVGFGQIERRVGHFAHENRVDLKVVGSIEPLCITGKCMPMIYTYLHTIVFYYSFHCNYDKKIEIDLVLILEDTTFDTFDRVILSIL